MKYVCELCGMIYDEDLGDSKSHIPAGTKFQDLPADYECPGCYSERQAFSPGAATRSWRTVAVSVMPPSAWIHAKEVSDK